MIRTWLLVLTLICAVLPGAASLAADENHVLVGKVWSPGEARQLTWKELLTRAGEARFVLIGEKHDNPGHHQLQGLLVTAIASAGRRPAIVWEMISLGQGKALAAFLERDDATAAGQGPAIGWQDTGWPDWRNYQPIAQAALDAGLDQHPGNIDRDTVRAVSREGFDALGDPTAAALARNAEWDEAAEAALNQDLIDSHCGHMPDQMLKPMGNVQRARDATMAAALLEADTGDGAVLIAGNGHVRSDRGVPAYLVPERRVIAIGLLEVQSGVTDPGAYLENDDQFDAVIFTDRVETPDRCEELRKRFGPKKD